MNNVSATQPHSSELAQLVTEHLDEITTYATHLIGDADRAMEYVAAGLQRAVKLPPQSLEQNGRAALYRAVTTACLQETKYPPRRFRFLNVFRAKQQQPVVAHADAIEATRMNTVKRSLMALEPEKRAAILLRDYAKFSYDNMATALQASPEKVARLLATARRRFGIVYREISI